MAHRVKGSNPTPAPRQYNVDWDLTTKDGLVTLRAHTEDGKRFLVASITSDGKLKLRPYNNHTTLPLSINSAGQIQIAA